MAHLYEKYPEIILFDATYKLNSHNFGLFIQLCIDGDGETEIVFLYICHNESREGIGAMLTIFKEMNPNWKKTKVFIGDKDFADRSIYTEHFPDAILQIWLFHVLQAFNREVTATKRMITTDQRQKALEVLRHSYNENYKELRNLNLEHVTSYFDDNWHNIIEEWASFGRNQHAHFMTSTNNRSERLNRTIKDIGKKEIRTPCFGKVS